MKFCMPTGLATSNMWLSLHWTNDGLSGSSGGHARQVPLRALLKTTFARLPVLGPDRVSGVEVASCRMPPSNSTNMESASVARRFERLLCVDLHGAFGCLVESFFVISSASSSDTGFVLH